MFMMFTMCICRIRMTSYHNPIRLDLHFRNRGGEGGICLRQCVWRFTKNNESQVNDIVIATRQVVVQNHACGRAPSFALTPPEIYRPEAVRQDGNNKHYIQLVFRYLDTHYIQLVYTLHSICVSIFKFTLHSTCVSIFRYTLHPKCVLWI